MLISSGKMDRAVTIEALAEAASGYPVETWGTLADLEWMEKVTVSGSERFATAQVAAQVQTVWRMHWRADMDPDAVDVPKTRRLVFMDRVFDITSAVEVGRRQGIELTTVAASRTDA